jgi:hypothetical protein
MAGSLRLSLKNLMLNSEYCLYSSLLVEAELQSSFPYLLVSSCGFYPFLPFLSQYRSGAEDVRLNLQRVFWIYVVAVSAALLFALPQLRNSQPGAPFF